MFQVHTMPVGRFQCNCSILSCPRTKQAVIIDPGGEAQRITNHVTERGYQVKYLLHTHAHLDHFGATGEVKHKCGGVVALHQQDLFLYDQAEMQSMMLGLPPTKPPAIDHFIEDEEHYGFGDFHIEALFTPGHSPGSASFLISAGEKQMLFAGDTMFRRSIGRTDLLGGDSQLILKSIRTRLFCLDGDTDVIPGHGPNTTIGEEMYENPFVGRVGR